MNPLTNVKNITKLNELELQRGTVDKKSWHDMYKESAWIFVGGLPYDLTEGDILTAFSQYGEIVNINLVRDKKSGRSKGFCFLCYANQKSTILAVDNFNGIKLCNRTIRVDHVANYKPPKEDERDDEITKMLKAEGCAPKPIKLEKNYSDELPSKKKKKVKKEKKKHKKKRKSDSDSESNFSISKKIKIKEEKTDPGYDKYEFTDRKKEQSIKKSRRTNKQTETSDSDASSDQNSSASPPSKKSSKSIYKEKVQYSSPVIDEERPSFSKTYDANYRKGGSDYNRNFSEGNKSFKRDSTDFDKGSFENKQSRGKNSSHYSYTQSRASKFSSFENSQEKRKYEKHDSYSSSNESSRKHKESRKEKYKDERNRSSKGESSHEYSERYKEKSKDYRYQKHKEFAHHDRASSDERPHRK